MKHLKTLRMSWFIAVLVAAILVAQVLASLLRTHFGLHVSGIALGAVCVGIAAGTIALIYDGNE